MESVVDDASDAAQVDYLRLRIREEGGTAVLLGRSVGQQVRLSSPQWEWGEMGWRTTIERALPVPGAVPSCDREAELASQAVTATELDGLLLPGGLATWMIRGHRGLRMLIEQMHEGGKPIGALGRGPKLLFGTAALRGKTVTCAPQMRDDLLFAVDPVSYVDEPVVRDGNLVTCRGSEDLPAFMRDIVATCGNQEAGGSLPGR